MCLHSKVSFVNVAETTMIFLLPVCSSEEFIFPKRTVTNDFHIANLRLDCFACCASQNIKKEKKKV